MKLPVYDQLELKTLRELCDKIHYLGVDSISNVGFLRANPKEQNQILLILFRYSISKFVVFNIHKNFDVKKKVLFDLLMNEERIDFPETGLCHAFYSMYLARSEYYPYDYESNQIQNALYHIHYVSVKDGSCEEILLKAGIVTLPKKLEKLDFDPSGRNLTTIFGGLNIKLLRILDRSKDGWVYLTSKKRKAFIREFFRKYSNLELTQISSGQILFLNEIADEEMDEKKYKMFRRLESCSKENYYKYKLYQDRKTFLGGTLDLPELSNVDLEIDTKLEMSENILNFLASEAATDYELHCLRRKYIEYEECIDGFFFAIEESIYEILKTGLAFRNCLSSFYMINVIADKDVIVFLKKEKTTICIIHINPRDRNIVDARLKYNNSVTDELNIVITDYARRHRLFWN